METEAPPDVSAVFFLWFLEGICLIIMRSHLLNFMDFCGNVK